jgi:hypothetical protein
MSKPLTLVNREYKGDVDPGSRGFFAQKLSTRSPSYFGPFWLFSPFLVVQMSAALVKRRLRQKHGIPHAAAFMAIV